LNSASHGAGRVLSRGEASNSISNSSMKKILKEFGVTLIGGGTDEAPDVYKNIDEVMIYQKELVKTEGVFSPKIVRMGEDGK
jgi:tRNA-splicing ligase RtcB